MAKATVTVRGDAVVPGRPDASVWAIELAALDGQPDAALAEVARRSDALGGVLDGLGVPAERRSTSGVSVTEEFDYVDGKQVRRGFRAATTVTVRLTDQSIAGRLIEQATALAEAAVRGPSWWIGPDNPARIDACRAAVDGARRKAEAYATALGLTLGPVIEVREPGAGGQPGPRPMIAMAMRAKADTAAMDIDSGELDVEAAVEVTYQLIG